MRKRAAEFGWPSGDRPGLLDYTNAVPQPIAGAVLQSLKGTVIESASQCDELLALHPVTDTPAARYSLKTASGRWFVRVSSRWGDPELERAVGRYLQDNGVAVNAPDYAGFRLDYDGDAYRVDVRQFISGHHFTNSREELSSLARVLSRCHEALRTFPQAHEIRKRAEERYARLATIQRTMQIALDSGDLALFSDNQKWVEAHRDWLQKVVTTFQPRLDQQLGAQCLHGQIHQGNVLYVGDDAVLIDLEEGLHTFAPPYWDLAYFVQRFCMFDDPDATTLKTRWQVVNENYGSNLALQEVTRMMQQAAYFSMAVIVEQKKHFGVITPQGEYDKFVRLDKQAEALGASV